MSNTKVAVAEKTASSVAEYDAELAAMYGASSGADGTDNIGREDTALPFLKVLQALSPEVTRGNEKYNKDARPGMFINSLTGELFDGETGVEVIRVYFSKKWIEWRPRDAGGGLARISQSEAEAKQHKTPDTGNDKLDTYINETHEVLSLVKGKFGWGPSVVSASKSKLPFVRKWNGTVMNQKFGEFTDEVAKRLPPDGAPKPYAVVFTLGTVSKTGPKGTYFIPTLLPAKRLATPAELKLATEFLDLVKAGTVQVEYTSPEAVGEDVDAVPGAGSMDGAA